MIANGKVHEKSNSKQSRAEAGLKRAKDEEVIEKSHFVKPFQRRLCNSVCKHKKQKFIVNLSPPGIFGVPHSDIS